MKLSRVILLAIGLGMLAYGPLGCATPTPVPDPPGPTPADVFAGAIVDCSAPEVVGEFAPAEPAVRACLVGEATSACLVEASASYRVDTIACVVRELGIEANMAVLGGRVGVDDSTVDAAARRWIDQEHLGYRSAR
jgi:hypothetical protein